MTTHVYPVLSCARTADLSRSKEDTSIKPGKEPSLTIASDSSILDLHGYSLLDGVRVAKVAIKEAHRRGLRRIELIHGHSTSHGFARSGTMKWELRGAIRRGELLAWIWHRRSPRHVFKEGSMILALKPTLHPAAGPFPSLEELEAAAQA